MLRVQEHTLDENSQRQGHRRVSAKPTLLANRDARTEVTSFQVYNFKMRAQIGTSNVEN